MCSSPDIIRVIISQKIRWARDVTRMREMRNAYKILVGKLQEKRILGRPRRRWKHSTKWVRPLFQSFQDFTRLHTAISGTCTTRPAMCVAFYKKLFPLSEKSFLTFIPLILRNISNVYINVIHALYQVWSPLTLPDTRGVHTQHKATHARICTRTHRER